MTNPAISGVELPEMDLLRKFDVPAPRYTSYPTADRFNASFGAEDYRKALAGRADAKEPADLSLYVHVPFCNDVCFYCGCNKIVTRDHSRSAEYIEMIGREADLVKEAVTGSTELEQLHFGGGTSRSPRAASSRSRLTRAPATPTRSSTCTIWASTACPSASRTSTPTSRRP